MASLKYAALGWLSMSPTLFQAYYGRHRRLRELLVTPESDLVIEGFPRCANSFAVFAFEHAQVKPVKIGHHLHASAQVLLGVRWGVPVLILLRDPAGAVASLITRHPEISIAQALARYRQFYRVVLRHADRVVVADFRTVTQSYGRVIERLNARFGKDFVPYTHSSSTDASIFSSIDRLNQGREGGAANMLARPSEEKAAVLAEAMDRVKVHASFEESLAVYRQLANCAV